jgi:hypothetical protein
MVVSIHQPNFFPYYPFFQKMESSDLFVILTHCQFEKNNYQNRFNKEGKWYTMSVNKGLDPINTKTYLNPQKDWCRIKNMLPSYRKILEEFDPCITDNLASTNSNIIFKIKEMLQIKTEIALDYPTDLLSTGRLVDICLKHKATKYISGISGKKYLDLSMFEQNNIEVIFQDEKEMINKPIIDVLND